MEFAAAPAKPQNQSKDASPPLHRTPLSPLTSASSKTSFRTDPDDAPHYVFPLKDMHNYTPNEVDPHQLGPPPTTAAAAALTTPHHPHHLAPVGSFPSSVSVVCGPIRGTLLVSRCKVVLDPGTAKEREVTPTEFERLGGRAATKKWKQSIRVLAADGTPGRPIGDWLSSIGLDLRASNPATATSGMRRLDGSDGSGARGAYSVEDAHDMMASHLHSCYVGLNPGDPTFTSLPRGFSHAPHHQPYHHTYDVSQMAYKDLLHLAAQRSNGGQPLRGLLQPPPGILAQREAYLTGQAPSRRRADPLPDSAQVMSELASYLAGQAQDPPWRLLRATRVPAVAGKDVDLRDLYFMVKKLGGFDEVTAQKAWGTVSQALHLPHSDTSSYTLRNCYQRFLLRFERQELALGRYAEEAAARQGSVPHRAGYEGSAQPLGLEQHGAAEDDAGLLLQARHELRMGAREQQQHQHQHMEADVDVSVAAAQYGDDSDDVQLVGEMMPLPRSLSADRGMGAAAVLHRRSSGSLFSEPGALPYSGSDSMAYDAPTPAAAAARQSAYIARGDSLQSAGMMDHHRSGGTYAHMEGLSIFSRQPSGNLSSSAAAYQYSTAADIPATAGLLPSSHEPSQSASLSDHNLALRQAYASHHAATTRGAPAMHDLHRTSSDQLVDDGGYGPVYASSGGYQAQSMAMPSYSASAHAHSQRGGAYASYQDPHYAVPYASGMERLAAAEAYQAASAVGGTGAPEPASYSQLDASRMAAAYRQQQQQQAHLAGQLALKRATPDSDMSMPDSAKRHHM